jgi:gluconokinase
MSIAASSIKPATAARERAPAMPSVLVLMGVSGCGKSTIGTQLAIRLRWEFEDGDWFHPARNVEKMHSGHPLTDEDRWPWLNAIGAFIDASRNAGRHVVIACSALKKRYRAVIVGDRSDVRLVYLKGPIELIARRIAARHEHFMPLELLQSQFDALEEPGSDENPVVVSIEPPPRVIVSRVLAALGAEPRQAGGSAPARG